MWNCLLLGASKKLRVWCSFIVLAYLVRVPGRVLLNSLICHGAWLWQRQYILPSCNCFLRTPGCEHSILHAGFLPKSWQGSHHICSLVCDNYTTIFFQGRSHAINICLIRITKLVTPRNLTTAKESRSSAGFVINLRLCQTPSDSCFCLRGLMWICKTAVYSILLTCLYTAKRKCKSQISLNSFFFL